MPGTEDYPYESTLADPALFHGTVEVSQADSNPAFYPPEQKSEPLLTEAEKAYLAEQEQTVAAQGGEDVQTGDGATVMSGEEANATAAKRSVPKSSSK